MRVHQRTFIAGIGVPHYRTCLAVSLLIFTVGVVVLFIDCPGEGPPHVAEFSRFNLLLRISHRCQI